MTPADDEATLRKVDFTTLADACRGFAVAYESERPESVLTQRALQVVAALRGEQ